MQMLIVSFVVMLFLVSIMAIGVIFGRKPLKGSCGGVGNALGTPNYVCDLCGNDPNKCEEETARAAKSPSKTDFYDAS